MQKATAISEQQTSLFTEGLSTFFPEAFHVSPIVLPAKEKEQKMIATCGPKTLEQFGRFSRNGLWAKTFLELLIGMEGWYSSKCALTWKLKGTRFNRLYCQLVPSMQIIGATGYGLLPTPTASDDKGGRTKHHKRTALNNWRDFSRQILGHTYPHPMLTMARMGYPSDWTVLPFQNGETKPIKEPETL